MNQKAHTHTRTHSFEKRKIPMQISLGEIHYCLEIQIMQSKMKNSEKFIKIPNKIQVIIEN